MDWLQQLFVCHHWPATEGDVDVVSSAVATETRPDTCKGARLAVRPLHIWQVQQCQESQARCVFPTSGRGTGGACWRWWWCRWWQGGPRQAGQLLTDVFQPIMFFRHTQRKIWKQSFSTRAQLNQCQMASYTGEKPVFTHISEPGSQAQNDVLNNLLVLTNTPCGGTGGDVPDGEPASWK